MDNSLSLCVICKNEEKNIGNLLKSIQGDLFDEIIIVDTGSTDRTLEVIRQYEQPSPKVFFFDWIEITLIVLPLFAPLMKLMDFGAHIPFGAVDIVPWIAILLRLICKPHF